MDIQDFPISKKIKKVILQIFKLKVDSKGKVCYFARNKLSYNFSY